nr:E5 [Human papillomavirus type 54]WAB54103.1 E5 [Human papillomavirus type 54]WBM83746.1 E5 protein [Human papillomavirus type 54]
MLYTVSWLTCWFLLSMLLWQCITTAFTFFLVAFILLWVPALCVYVRLARLLELDLHFT